MAAVAYVTRAAEVRFGREDVLVVDASDQAIMSSVTATAVLRAAHRRGAKVFSCPGLHAKVLLLDDVAVVGSANLSAASVNQKIEAALITADHAIVSQVQSLIDRLARRSDKIDEDFLRRIAKIKVLRKRPGSSRRKNVPSTTSTASKSEKERVRRKRASMAVAKVLARHGVALDRPTVLLFRDKTFTFTGRFDFGTQEECARATRRHGGRRTPSNAVTLAVDVLVVGARGNPNYLWEKHGTKMERASELRRRLGKPLIISEDCWQAALGR